MYTALLFLHFAGLAMGVGTGFALLRISHSNRNLPAPEIGALMQKISSLRLNAYTGLTLLIVSGLGMTLMRPGLFAAAGGVFHAKLLIVALMVANMGVMHVLTAKARRTGSRPPALLRKLGNINFSMGLLTILLAVIAFH